MSKRAEQKALEAYPVRGEWIGNQYGYWDSDINSKARENFREGYNQAEKDTIERVCEWLSRHYDIDLVRFKKAVLEEEQ